MLCDRNGVVTTSLGIREVSLKHSGIFHYTNFMMWSSLPLLVFHITESDKFTFQLLQPTQLWDDIYFSVTLATNSIRKYFYFFFQNQLSVQLLLITFTTTCYHLSDIYHNHVSPGSLQQLPRLWFLSLPHMVYALHISQSDPVKAPRRLCYFSAQNPSQAFSFTRSKSRHSHNGLQRRTSLSYLLELISHCWPPPSWGSRHTNLYTVCFFCQKHHLPKFLRDQLLCSPFFCKCHFLGMIPAPLPI